MAEEESDDEYASTDEFFSSDEDMFSRDDSVLTECVKEGVNVIVPCFGAPTHFEVEYHGKPAITPLVISFPCLVPYKSDKVVPYKYNVTILEDGVEVPIQPMPNVGNIAETRRVTRSGVYLCQLFVKMLVRERKLLKMLNSRRHWVNLVGLR